MQRVRYLERDVNKMCQDLEKMYSLTPEVIQLVRYDLSSGMSRDDVKKYCSKKISLLRMKIISECIWRNVDEDVIKRLASRDKTDETLELIYKMIRENVEIATIDSIGPDNDRLLECLEMYRKGLNVVEKPINEVGDKDNKVADSKFADANKDNQSGVTDDNANKKEEAIPESVTEPKKPINIVKNVVENKIVSLVMDAADNKTVDAENSSNETIITDASNIVENDSSNTEKKCVPNPEVNTTVAGLSKDDIQELIKGFGSEIAEKFGLVLKNHEASEVSLRKDFERTIEELKCQMKDKDKQIEQRSEDLLKAKKTIDELKEQLEQSIQTYDEKIKQVEALQEERKAIADEDADKESNQLREDYSSSSKVIQFSDRAGKNSLYTNIEYSKRKTSGLGALAATLCCKKRSRRSMMQMSINGELTKEQLVQIVEAIKAGLTEEQLCQLIENKVPAERMPQIIEIAVLENKMGYSA